MLVFTMELYSIYTPNLLWPTASTGGHSGRHVRRQQHGSFRCGRRCCGSRGHQCFPASHRSGSYPYRGAWNSSSKLKFKPSLIATQSNSVFRRDVVASFDRVGISRDVEVVLGQNPWVTFVFAGSTRSPGTLTSF